MSRAFPKFVKLRDTLAIGLMAGLLIAAKVAAYYRAKVDRQQIAVSRKCDKIAATTTNATTIAIDHISDCNCI